jgi:hypothetical protein
MGVMMICDRCQKSITGEPAPSHFFDKRAADALANEVRRLIERKVIDARSPAGDALLDYVNPGATESIVGKLSAVMEAHAASPVSPPPSVEPGWRVWRHPDGPAVGIGWECVRCCRRFATQEEHDCAESCREHGHIYGCAVCGERLPPNLTIARVSPVSPRTDPRDAAIEALSWLVRLKDRKESAGKDQTYNREQPLAWEAARAALRSLPSSPGDANPSPSPRAPSTKGADAKGDDK